MTDLLLEAAESHRIRIRINFLAVILSLGIPLKSVKKRDKGIKRNTLEDLRVASPRGWLVVESTL